MASTRRLRSRLPLRLLAQRPHALGTSPARLAAARGAPHADDELLYPGTCRPRAGATLSIPDTPRGVNWRFRAPDGETVTFVDIKQRAQSFVAGRDFGDFLVWRRDDVPAYQLACAVDDALMLITEVVRGADLLKSTARQLLVQRALGYATPHYYHCDLVTGARGERLAMRHAALSLRALRDSGHTPASVRALFDAPRELPTVLPTK